MVSEITFGLAPAATHLAAISRVFAVVLLNLKKPQSVAIAIYNAIPIDSVIGQFHFVHKSVTISPVAAKSGFKYRWSANSVLEIW